MLRTYRMENWLTKIEISSHYENLIFNDDLTYNFLLCFLVKIIQDFNWVDLTLAFEILEVDERAQQTYAFIIIP